MAEWLRRLTRNQMGSSRVGSNPTRSGTIFDEKWESSISSLVPCKKMITMGFEPTIFWFVVRRLIRWATRPMLTRKKCEVHGSQFSWRRILWMHHMRVNRHSSCDGRVVKALDLKSNGIFPRRFEPYSQRYFWIQWIRTSCSTFKKNHFFNIAPP